MRSPSGRVDPCSLPHSSRGHSRLGYCGRPHPRPFSPTSTNVRCPRARTPSSRTRRCRTPCALSPDLCTHAVGSANVACRCGQPYSCRSAYQPMQCGCVYRPSVRTADNCLVGFRSTLVWVTSRTFAQKFIQIRTRGSPVASPPSYH